MWLDHPQAPWHHLINDVILELAGVLAELLLLL